MRLLLVALLAGGASCNVVPEETVTSKNGTEVTLLVTIDDCKIYRFYDGRNVYFAKCPASTTVSSEHCYMAGKVRRCDPTMVTASR